MKSGLQIREWLPSEAAEIERLARAIWPVVYSEIVTQGQIDYMLDRMYAPSVIRDEIESRRIIYLRAEASDRGNEGSGSSSVKGFAAYGPVNTGQWCELHKLYVLPEQQRSGVGRALVSAAASGAASGGARGLQLRVNRQNHSAIAFYQRVGFIIAREDCLDIGGGYVMDDYILEMPFDRGT